MNLSDIAIKRPVFASMASAALVLFGAIGYKQLSVREFPDVDPVFVSVSVSLRGANPHVVESRLPTFWRSSWRRSRGSRR